MLKIRSQGCLVQTNWWMIRVGLVLDWVDGSTKNGTWRDELMLVVDRTNSDK
jgi:hypothetical protein